MAEINEPAPLHGLTLDQKTVEVLVAHIIPTSKYFESRFDHLQDQVQQINKDVKRVDEGLRGLEVRMDKRFEQVDAQFLAVRQEVKELEVRVDKRFEQVDKHFEQVDKRFEQVDKRFEQVDKRFEQVDKRFEQVDKRFTQVDEKLDKIIDRIDRRIDAGLRENRSQMTRLFTFAMTFSAISMMGLLGKMLKLF